MEQIFWIIIITAIAGVGGTGLGGLIAALIKRDSSKMVSLFLSFAGGVMLSVACFDLILDAIEETGVSIYIVVLGILLGYLAIFILNYFIDVATNHEIEHIDGQHPKTADSLDELIHSDHYKKHKTNESPSQLFIAGLVMAFAIALHNLPEGMVIGASFSASDSSAIFTPAGLALAIVIGLHNIPEGMAVSVPLISGGMSRVKAVAITALSGVPTIIGAIFGYYIGRMGDTALALSLSFASGAMLYVVFGELLPESILMWKSKLPAFALLIGVIVGLLIIF